jgi:predicted AAA+ superfamily ATPase
LLSYVPRILDVKTKLEKKSHFLFGPRQTGKSFLIKHELPQDWKLYNLLDNEVFVALSRRPSLIRKELSQNDRFIIIDEIQKLPQLLDEVHLMIEENNINFLLTGSSARKLRRGGVNLLGGRARNLSLHPFCYLELKPFGFDLFRTINYGLLPSIYLSDEPLTDLRAYIGNYLQQEVIAEGLTRNVPAFSRFLEVAALCSGNMINMTKIASDAQVARTTVHEYFKILEDTLLAHTLPAWKETKKRKPISTSKFYFFDLGVVNVLRNQGEIKPRSPDFGEAFETFIFHELKAYTDYSGSQELAYWRSTSNYEVDFILNNQTAIEVKGKETISNADLKGLRALMEEKLVKNYVVVSMVQRAYKEKDIQILPWQNFLERLWQKDFG